MRPGRAAAFERVLRAEARDSGEPALDAADRRAVFADAVLRKSADDPVVSASRICHQPQACASLDEADGVGIAGPQAADDGAWQGTHGLPLPAEKPGNYQAESGVGRGHHLRAAGAGVSVLNGDIGLAQPVRGELAAVE